MTDFVVTLATVPAVLALCNLAKQCGLPTRWTPLLAAILGVVASVCDTLWASPHPATAGQLYAAIASGLILGLSASGLYDVTDTKKADPTTAKRAETTS